MTQPADREKLTFESHAAQYADSDGVIRKDGFYFPRFQWWMPWGVTRWWLPRWFEGGDEWCNVPFCVVIPPFGCFLFFWHQMRSMPCDEEWALMDNFTRADYSPCGFLHDGRVDHSRHHHSFFGRLCPQSREWLQARENTSKKNESDNDGLQRRHHAT